MPLVLKYNVDVKYEKFIFFIKIVTINSYWFTAYCIKYDIDFELIRMICEQLKTNWNNSFILFDNEENRRCFIQELYDNISHRRMYSRRKY